MLEVVSAGVGFGIYGALKGFSAAKDSKPVRKFIGHSLIFAVCLFEVNRRISIDSERQHLWVNTHRTSRFVNDAIDTGTPKYLLANLPVLMGVYSGCLASVGILAFIFRR